MSWEVLNLWADEEQKIQSCLKEALQQLIDANVICTTDEEKIITGKLHPHIRRIKKEKTLAGTLQPEASVFANEDDPDPFGHPDLRFTWVDHMGEDFNYDVECKLVRVEKADAETDYCYNYVKHGILRYQTGKYAQSSPPMGTMLGYVQEGDLELLLVTINEKIAFQKKKHYPRLQPITRNKSFQNKGVSSLTQPIHRDTAEFVLLHLWADFR
ncbi:MAG: hypothetical protein GY797_16925 [Deltaproteobacteria bacterium]|nr:hypothetical protein [Deltaproteobacteria bacterium]